MAFEFVRSRACGASYCVLPAAGNTRIISLTCILAYDTTPRERLRCMGAYRTGTVYNCIP